MVNSEIIDARMKSIQTVFTQEQIQELQSRIKLLEWTLKGITDFVYPTAAVVAVALIAKHTHP